ncbi:MAG: efflux RND transporter periplasmic adaptor subunit [Bryobacteraceae bacterium]|nr:efflux RND transporter periplasmic adaptor subunit [Bryobacteraceae bacterium]
MSRNRTLASISLVGLAFLTGCVKEKPIQAKQESGGPIAVQMAAVKSRQVTRVVESVGTFFPFDEAIISAEVDGKVDQVKIDLGDQVTANQILIHISDEEQRYLLAQQEAQLRQSLEKLGLKDERDRVADIKLTPDVRRADADLFEAEQRYKRQRQLADQGIGSAAELDAAQARFKSAQAAYDQTVNQTRNIIQEVERFKAVLDLQRKKLRDTTVRAPFPGLVKERTVAVGQYVRANAPLVTLVKIDPLRLRIEIPERMGPWIKTGQVAEIITEAYEDKKFTGQIWRISPTVDANKRTFVVEALVQNVGMALKPGSYARARIPTQKVETVISVPARAVNYVLGSNKAYVVENGVVEAREVKLGDRFENEVEIVEGVKEGEEVAFGPNINRLDTGSRVRKGEGKKAAPRPAE